MFATSYVIGNKKFQHFTITSQLVRLRVPVPKKVGLATSMVCRATNAIKGNSFCHIHRGYVFPGRGGYRNKSQVEPEATLTAAVHPNLADATAGGSGRS